jgi:mannosyltransferase OCH1-like enzyme
MNELNFEDLDRFLLSRSKIIHQVWFGIIPNRRDAKKAYKSLQKYRDSWLTQNPKWVYFCWNLKNCRELIKSFYPQHIELYDSYSYHIQRCDTVRYFILHRYGGLYADMDYFCNASWDKVIEEYPKDIYLVETPNKMYRDIHVSNSLMYSEPRHVFWSKLFIELEIHKTVPIYYSKHLTIMFTTGPGILNRVFNRYRTSYKLNYYPYKLFHPYGISHSKDPFSKIGDIYAYHMQKGCWHANDTSVINFLYQEYKVLLISILVLVLPSLVYYLLHKKLISQIRS